MNDENRPQRKIIIDEDWKSQVEAEREALKQQDAGEPSGMQAPPGAADQLPPASFPLLISTLATQAMTALGQLPDPIDQKPVLRIDLGKHHIDTLAVLQEKTKGNLSPEENQMLDEVLHQLRMLYVAVRNSVQG